MLLKGNIFMRDLKDQWGRGNISGQLISKIGRSVNKKASKVGEPIFLFDCIGCICDEVLVTLAEYSKWGL